MLKCWEENPIDRPTFAKLKETMKEMERNHKVSLAEALCNLINRNLMFNFLVDF